MFDDSKGYAQIVLENSDQSFLLSLHNPGRSLIFVRAVNSSEVPRPARVT